MTAKEINQVLNTFSIIIDTREQVTERAERRYKAFEVPYSRAVLDYGDYTYNLALPGEDLYDISKRISARCVVERKQDLDELAMCFTRSRDRFQREFERAKEQHAKVFLLVENASLDLLLKGQYRSKLNPKAFVASLIAWSIRYDFTPLFCEMGHSGRVIREVLYRDAKDRLERGCYGREE